jgi:hypothetical protein
MTKTITYQRTNKAGRKKAVTLKTNKPLHIHALEDFMLRCIRLDVNIDPDTLIDSVTGKGAL